MCHALLNLSLFSPHFKNPKRPDYYYLMEKYMFVSKICVKITQAWFVFSRGMREQLPPDALLSPSALWNPERPRPSSQQIGQCQEHRGLHRQEFVFLCLSSCVCKCFNVFHRLPTLWCDRTADLLATLTLLFPTQWGGWCLCVRIYTTCLHWRIQKPSFWLQCTKR